MSKETAKKLLEELQTNEELKAKVEGVTDPEELVKIAHNSGYDVTMEELIDAEKAHRRIRAEETDEKLSFDDLENVAGGNQGNGELAPDGHEMGCVLSYHLSKYSEETGIYCNHMYYCTGEACECGGAFQLCTGVTKV